MSATPSSSVWFVLAEYERVPIDGLDRAGAERTAARLDEDLPHLAPHRAVRYDLADPERDGADELALRRVACLARLANPNEAELRAIQRVIAVANRLGGES